ncbi:MAG: class I SAM-dependent methyltransferase, partial [Nanoarchaeota archaeon]
MKSQQKVWNNIAFEWNKYKTTSDPIVENFVKKSSANLLDLGCGSGRNFNSSIKKTIIYGLDFSDEMLKLAKTNAKKLKINVNLIQHDLTKKLPFESNFFNNAVCIATLHCIKGKTNRKNLLKETYRILKPKGQLLIKVWNRNSPRFKGKTEKYIKWTDKGERYYYFYSEEEKAKVLGKQEIP